MNETVCRYDWVESQNWLTKMSGVATSMAAMPTSFRRPSAMATMKVPNERVDEAPAPVEGAADGRACCGSGSCRLSSSHAAPRCVMGRGEQREQPRVA